VTATDAPPTAVDPELEPHLDAYRTACRHNDDPTPAAFALPDRRTGRLVIASCPYCRRRHEHSPGWGTRHSHCLNGEYALTPPRGLTVEGGVLT
jgi:hypothetical protein